jgi:Dolichyl-phosphate-mannose-protein mannosyltransferase
MHNSDSASQNTDTRNMWSCMVLVVTALILVWPFANIGYGDDVAYAHLALILERTGHLVYNGWESAFLISQVFWGALFIRVFGSSFVCLRLSTIPFALGAVGLCYKLVRRAGLQPSSAVFVTLLFGLCPLYLPVAVSFMTDIPGVFFTFASLYSFARAEEIAGEPKSYGWLALGAAAGLIGGTGRQIVWLVPLVVLPYLAWVRRRHWWFRLSAEAAWVAVLAGVNYTMAWFRHQPYTVFQPSVFSELILMIEKPFQTAVIAARLSLLLVLLILPAAVPLVFRSAEETWRGPRGRKMLVAALLLVVLAAIAIHPSLASIPWISSTLNWEGINGSAPLPGRPIVLTRPIRALAAVTVYFSVCILAGELWNIRRMARRISELVLKPSSSEFLLAAMSLFSVVYFALVLVRGADFDIFDRYLLPIMPWAATVALLWFAKDNLRAEETARRAAPYAWVLLGVLAFYGIASTQDLWALAKARVEATRTLEAAGVPRTAIDAGFEYNAWTELMTSGHLNFYRVINPLGAYRPGFSQTPSVVPQYRLEYEPTPETPASKFGSVPYRSLLPPFHKQVSIDRVVIPPKGNR